jgi:hypothetical protein
MYSDVGTILALTVFIAIQNRNLYNVQAPSMNHLEEISFLGYNIV